MHRAIFFIVALISVPLLASGETRDPDQKIKFKEVDGNDLRLHVFKHKTWKTTDQRAAIVFFFGGGWVGGSPEQFYPHCTHLAAKGMVAISAEYRTKSSHGTEPQHCVEDGKSAIRWVREHAVSLGINPNKIIAGGGSAGGHVASCTGTISGFETGNLKTSSIPAALVLFNPVCDTSTLGYGNKLIGKDWQKISPIHNLSKNTPPVCIFHGKADTTVPFNNVKRFKEQMEILGLRCELHSYDGEKHGFFNFGRGDGSAYRDTINKMDSFLSSLGFLKSVNGK